VSADPLDGVALVVNEPTTAWKRAVVSTELAHASSRPSVWLVLSENGADLDGQVASGAADSDPYWRAAIRLLDGAAAHLQDVRDADGVLVEVTGPVAPALGSKKFRKAALQRLGAQQAFAATPDGVQLRLRDAWRLSPPADVAALSTEPLVGEAVWLVDVDGVRGVVVDGSVVDAAGVAAPIVEGPSGGADRDQIVFARALLAFLGGITLALGLALALALR